MPRIYTVEGNTSGGSTLVANGGGVASKSYDTNYSRIAEIWRPKYLVGEAEKVRQEFIKWVGYLEKASNSFLEDFKANAGYNNYTVFAGVYRKATGINVQAQPWCDCFVDTVMINALGVERAGQLLGGFSAYTPTSSGMLKRAGATRVSAVESTTGDIIFFKNSTRICHTGFVNKGVITVQAVETSTSEYSQAQFITEMKALTGAATLKGVLSKTLTLSKTRNSNHGQVLLVQKYLKSLGHYKGVPDRDFGGQTETAVNSYQSKVLKYTRVDGEITSKGKMWKSLLGMV